MLSDAGGRRKKEEEGSVKRENKTKQLGRWLWDMVNTMVQKTTKE
jgi:hypothetical protein